MKLRRVLIMLLVAVPLANGIYQICTHRWEVGRGRDDTTLILFADECAARIPADAPVFLVADSHQTLFAARLYPRPVRVCDRETARRVAPLEGWMVDYVFPFDRSRALVARVRDLP